MSLVDQLFEHHKAKFAHRIEDDSVSPKEFHRWMMLHLNGKCVPNCLFCEMDNESARFILEQAIAMAKGHKP